MAGRTHRDPVQRRDVVLLPASLDSRREAMICPWCQHEHPEYIRQRTRRRGALHCSSVCHHRKREYCAQARAKNPELANQRGREHRARLRDQFLSVYGRICACCGEVNPKFLTIDHINNDGSAYRNRGECSYSWIIKNNFPDNLQILCWNCNVAKSKYGGCVNKSIILP